MVAYSLRVLSPRARLARSSAPLRHSRCRQGKDHRVADAGPVSGMRVPWTSQGGEPGDGSRCIPAKPVAATSVSDHASVRRVSRLWPAVSRSAAAKALQHLRITSERWCFDEVPGRFDNTIDK